MVLHLLEGEFLLVDISELKSDSRSPAAGRATHAAHLLREMPKWYPSPPCWAMGCGAYNPIPIKQKLTLRIHGR